MSPVAGELLFRPRLLRIPRPGLSTLLKHQLLIPAIILAGLLGLLVHPARLLRSAIAPQPSTLLALHKGLSKQKYRMLFSDVCLQRTT
jgi:hypothetical protein